MKDFQTAGQILKDQVVSLNHNGQWTEPAKVVDVQHNRRCGRNPQGLEPRGVVVLFDNGTVAAMDDDTIVRTEKVVAHA